MAKEFHEHVQKMEKEMRVAVVRSMRSGIRFGGVVRGLHGSERERTLDVWVGVGAGG